jgi:hypothetical protein
VSRKLIALILFSLWLPCVCSGLVKNENRDELANRQQLANVNPLNVGQALNAHQSKQKPSLGLISGVIVSDFGVRRAWSQTDKQKSEHSKRSLKIYALNRVLLI